MGVRWLADTHSVQGSRSFPVLLLPVGVLSQAGSTSGPGRGSALRMASKSYPIGAKAAAQSWGGGEGRVQPAETVLGTQGVALGE